MALFNRQRAVISTTAFRLAASTVAVFLVIAAVLIGFLFWQTNQVLTNQVLTTLAAEADALRAEAASGSPSSLVEAVTARSRPEGPGLYFLTDGSGRKLAGNLSRIPPEVTADREGAVFRYRPNLLASQQERIGVALSLTLPRGERLIIGRDVEDQRAFADNIKRLFMISFGILTLAGLITGYIVSRSVLKRIDTINTATRQIMAGDLAQRVPLGGSGDELDDLATNLNAMLERIEQLMNGMREVSENIAHDLKTPLNRLRNRTEAALRDPRGAPAYREGLERTIEEADDLIQTFNALLLIARLEAGALDQSTAILDCGTLVRDVAELYAPVAEEAGLEFTVDVPDGHLIRANPQLISQAVANLIDNAIKYTKAGAQLGPIRAISVALTATSSEITVNVADRGPGIAPADRERALKRFVRLDASRSAPGTGLGLSLVAAVARIHGGTIALSDNAPGLKVSLVLPRAQGASVGSPERAHNSAVAHMSPNAPVPAR
jgi:signal transduction histidine kinase